MLASAQSIDHVGLVRLPVVTSDTAVTRQVFDESGDGHISKAEMENVMARLGRPMSKRKLHAMFDQWDGSGANGS